MIATVVALEVAVQCFLSVSKGGFTIPETRVEVFIRPQVEAGRTGFNIDLTGGGVDRVVLGFSEQDFKELLREGRAALHEATGGGGA